MTKRVGHVSLALFSSSLLLGAVGSATATERAVVSRDTFSIPSKPGYFRQTVTQSRLGHKIITDRHDDGTIEVKSFSNRNPDGTFDDKNPSYHIVNSPLPAVSAADKSYVVRTVNRQRKGRKDTSVFDEPGVDKPKIVGSVDDKVRLAAALDPVKYRGRHNVPRAWDPERTVGLDVPKALVEYRDVGGVSHKILVDTRPDRYQHAEDLDAKPAAAATPSTPATLDEALLRAELRSGKILLSGAPGSGKAFIARQLGRMMAEQDGGLAFERIPAAHELFSLGRPGESAPRPFRFVLDGTSRAGETNGMRLLGGLSSDLRGLPAELMRRSPVDKTFFIDEMPPGK